MPRGLTTPQQTAIANNPSLALLAELVFKTYTVYVWSGLGSLVVGGNTYLGVGSLGKISAVSESNQILATGITISLSSIAQANLELPDLQANLQLSNTVTLSLALLTPGTRTLIGSPIVCFAGYMGQCTIDESATDSTVTIAVESKLAQLNRGKAWRYAETDAKYWNPAEGAFNWTVYLQDYVFRWGN